MGQLANFTDGSVEVRELKQAGTTAQQLRNEGFSGIRTVELYEEGRRGIGTWDDQAADFEATVDIGAGGGPTVAAAAVATVPRCRVRVRSPWEP